jgi:hypothetical protein
LKFFGLRIETAVDALLIVVKIEKAPLLEVNNQQMFNHLEPSELRTIFMSLEDMCWLCPEKTHSMDFLTNTNVRDRRF